MFTSKYYVTYTWQHRGIVKERSHVAQEGDKGDSDTHCNEDDGDFRQGTPCKDA